MRWVASDTTATHHATKCGVHKIASGCQCLVKYDQPSTFSTYGIVLLDHMTRSDKVAFVVVVVVAAVAVAASGSVRSLCSWHGRSKTLRLCGRAKATLRRLSCRALQYPLLKS